MRTGKEEEKEGKKEMKVSDGWVGIEVVSRAMGALDYHR